MLILDKITLTTANIEFKQHNKILLVIHVCVDVARSSRQFFSILWTISGFLGFESADLAVCLAQGHSTVTQLSLVSKKQIYLKCSTFKK